LDLFPIRLAGIGALCASQDAELAVRFGYCTMSAKQDEIREGFPVFFRSTAFAIYNPCIMRRILAGQFQKSIFENSSAGLFMTISVKPRKMHRTKLFKVVREDRRMCNSVDDCTILNTRGAGPLTINVIC
jgi:hypothetical protein